MGSFPEGFTSPKMISARAVPDCEPQYQASTMAFTLSTHGIATAFPETMTTASRGFTFASASMTASWPYGRPSPNLSESSQS